MSHRALFGSCTFPSIGIDFLSSAAHFTMYADHISVIISNPSHSVLEQNCDGILKTLNHWFSQNRLFLNTEKTQVIRFKSRQKKCDDFNMKIDSTTISSTKKDVKFLGVYLDGCLTWKHQCETLVFKISSITYLFRNIRGILSREQLFNLYYALVDLRLRYGICFWRNSVTSTNVFIAQTRIL